MAEIETSYLDQLKSAIETNQVAARSRAAGNWFRSLVNRARGAFSDETPQSILTRSESLTSRSILGKMYFYSYNPKWKDKLPWYDTFPLVFPIERYPDGFLGLNFHYLAPKFRAILLDRVTAKVGGGLINWKKISKIREIAPTVKRYRFDHIMKKVVPIEENEQEIAIFLPTERFKKASRTQVWADSKRKFG